MKGRSCLTVWNHLMPPELCNSWLINFKSAKIMFPWQGNKYIRMFSYGDFKIWEGLIEKHHESFWTRWGRQWPAVAKSQINLYHPDISFCKQKTHLKNAVPPLHISSGEITSIIRTAGWKEEGQENMGPALKNMGVFRQPVAEPSKLALG